MFLTGRNVLGECGRWRRGAACLPRTGVGSEGRDRPLALAFVLFQRRARIGQDLQTMAASPKKPSQSWWQADTQGMGARPTQPGRAAGRRVRPGSCPGQALLPTTCGQTSLAHSVRQGIRPGTGSATEGVQWHSRLSINHRVDWLSTAEREPTWPRQTQRVLFASPRLITSCPISVPRDTVWQTLAQGEGTKPRAGTQGFSARFSGQQLALGLCCSRREVLGPAA